MFAEPVILKDIALAIDLDNRIAGAMAASTKLLSLELVSLPTIFRIVLQ